MKVITSTKIVQQAENKQQGRNRAGYERGVQKIIVFYKALFIWVVSKILHIKNKVMELPMNSFFLQYHNNQLFSLVLVQPEPTATIFMADHPSEATSLAPFIPFNFNYQPPPGDFKTPEGGLSMPSQANDELIRNSGCQTGNQMDEHRRYGRRNDDYNPKKILAKDRKKKVYQKDQQRNVLPNALSKLFFFIKSPAKSESLLKKIIENDHSLGKFLNPAKFYSYHNFMKSKMERFMTNNSLRYLFQLNDPDYNLFTLQEQLAIIKVNAMLVRSFLKNHTYLQFFVNSSRSPKNKISWYIKKYRIIEAQALTHLEKAKSTLDFSILSAAPSH